MDKHKILRLQNTWRESNKIHDLHRLEDLRDKQHQDHQWMTALNPAEGAILTPQKWVSGMRIRLGCHFAAVEQICEACSDK
eukprot:14789141-Heterocapsa_arctica.AAC.1